MTRRDGAEMRKERIQEIAQDMLKALNRQQQLPLSETLAALQYKHGLTKEKILEYMSIMEKLRQFTIDHEHDRILKQSETQ